MGASANYRMQAGAACAAYLDELASAGRNSARANEMRLGISDGLGRWNDETPPALEYQLPYAKTGARYTRSLDHAITAWASRHRENEAKKDAAQKKRIMDARIREAMQGHTLECHMTYGDHADVRIDGKEYTWRISEIKRLAFEAHDDGGVTTPIWRAVYSAIQAHRAAYQDHVRTTRISDGSVRVQPLGRW